MPKYRKKISAVNAPQMGKDQNVLISGAGMSAVPRTTDFLATGNVVDEDQFCFWLDSYFSFSSYSCILGQFV